MKKAEGGFLIGKAAARTGTSVSALRFYEDKGLISSERTPGGNRVFRASEIRRISFIVISQQLGFSLAEVKDQLDKLPEGRTPMKADWSKISRSFKRDIQNRIDGLERLRDKLDGCIGCGCLSLKVCALYNPKDEIASKGSGPRFLLGDKSNQSKIA